MTRVALERSQYLSYNKRQFVLTSIKSQMTDDEKESKAQQSKGRYDFATWCMRTVDKWVESKGESKIDDVDLLISLVLRHIELSSGQAVAIVQEAIEAYDLIIPWHRKLL